MAQQSTDTVGHGQGVQLGVLDDMFQPWETRSCFFRSKAGGKPAWLNLADIPVTICQKCTKPLLFICQIYAPVDEKEECFHRMLFVFACTNADCNQHNSSVPYVVFRSQLSRKNQFYSYEPPEEVPEFGKDVTPEKFGCTLCRVCGSPGTKHCGKCQSVNYCSRDHQVLHWKCGHKKRCAQDGKDVSDDQLGYVLKEFLVVMDDEVSDCEGNDEDSSEEDENDAMDRYNAYIKKKGSGTMAGCETLDDLPETKEDSQFVAFKKAMARSCKELCVRYKRGGTPLWASSEHIPSNADIPNCSLCSAERKFEFQLMPQMLNHLKADDRNVDWATVAVYTCSRSCSSNSGYVTEFTWKQDYSS